MKRSLALTVLLAGCSGSVTGGTGPGSASGIASCTITDTTKEGPFISSFTQCIEISGATADQINNERNGCSKSTTLGDGGFVITPSFSEAPCSRSGAVAGCQVKSGNLSQTQWTYADGDGGLSAKDLARICTNSGGTTVAP